MKRGFVLVVSSALIVVIILIIASFFAVAYNDLATANTISSGVKAYYLADAGIAKKFMDLRSGNTSNISNETFTLATGYTGKFTVIVNQLAGGTFPTYRLSSTGTYKDAAKTVSLTVRAISCTRYSYLSNDEDRLYWWGQQPIWFITGDVLNGPLHTNDQLHISGNPVFEGPVSSVAASIEYYHGGPPADNPDFQESLTLGAPTVQLPSSSDIIPNIRTAAQQSGGLYLTGNTAVTLLSNGTMNVTNAAKGWKNRNMAIPSNGALFVQDGYLDISGVLNGGLTAGSNGNIYVVNNLVYHSDPRTDPNSNDMLGLVSQNNIYVDSAAPYNIEIDAYIVALNTSFGVENYAYGLKGTLSIFGGITQVRRGPIGTFNSVTNQRISGYTKDYVYDERLMNSSPFYFPPARDSDGRIIYRKILWAET